MLLVTARLHRRRHQVVARTRCRMTRSPSVSVGSSPDNYSRRRRRDHTPRHRLHRPQAVNFAPGRRRRDHTPRHRQHRPQAVTFAPGRRDQAGQSVVIPSRPFSRQSPAAETAAAVAATTGDI